MASSYFQWNSYKQVYASAHLSDWRGHFIANEIDSLRDINDFSYAINGCVSFSVPLQIKFCL